MRKGANQRAAPNRAAPADGLPAPLVGLDLEARRAVRVRTVEALRGGRTPLTLVAVADDAAGIAEEAVRQAVRAAPPPPSACREGCDWCCHLTVGAGVPEVVRVIEYLRRTLTADEFDALRERVRRLDARRRELNSTPGDQIGRASGRERG